MPEETARSLRDTRIAGVAGRQHGVISVQQLYELGVSSSAISDRVAVGRLHRIHRGVYAVGHPNLGNEGRWMAAVLACGDGAVLSHRSAAQLWGMLSRTRRPHEARGCGDEALVDVLVPTAAGRARRAGIRLHRSRTLSPAECTLRAGIPVTNPARTLVDLRRILPSKLFARALREAEYLRLPIRPGFDPDRTRTDLEAMFLSLVRRHRLPRPEVNVRLDRFLVDFLWPSQHLIVEVDGWESHRTRSAFEEDRARDARLKVLGYEVVRFTWRQVEDLPRDVARVVRTLLRSKS